MSRSRRIILYLLLLVLATVAAEVADNEVGYLLEFKKGINADPLINQWDPSSLSDPESCPETWPGITCDLASGSVVGISLDRLGLIGDLKFSTLLGLKSLQNLSLAGNFFTGRLVPAMGSMSTLQRLDLSGNNFFGPIPGRINELWALQYLNLSRNSFSGWFPAGQPSISFRNLQQLRILDLHANNLSGDIASVLAELVAVEYIDLSSNLFGGGLDGLGQGNISGLANTARYLNLSGNGLSGGFWKEDVIALFRNLEVLDLGSCGVSGYLPSLGSLSKLTVLNLVNNSLFGKIQEELVNGSVPLQELDLSLNGFTGSIQQVTSISLVTINLSHNQLSGLIPFRGSSTSELLSLPSSSSYRLESLDLSHNSFDGTLGSGIENWPLLKLLNLSNNFLSGKLPDGLSKLTFLEYLDLSENAFVGSIPDNLPSSLISLNLSDNNFSGNVPDSLSNKFNISSFHPGNPALNFPKSSNSVPAHIPSQPHPSRKNIRTPWLVAISVMVCLFIAAFLVSIPLMQRKRSRSSDELRHRDVAEDAKKRGVSRTHRPTTSLSFSNDHLLASNLRSLSGQPELASPTIDVGVSDVNDMQEIQPEVAGRKSSPRSPLSTSPHFVEANERAVTLDTLDVSSPDRFTGQLFFLDSSMAFTADDLARAPAEVLGRSHHGTLYKATLDSGHMLTVKWLRVGLVKSKKEFAKEVKKIGSIRHPNIVPLRAYYWGPLEQERLLLADYVQGDSLALHLYETTPRRFSLLSLRERLRVAVDVACCLQYLHDRGQPHGNLKPSNILLDGPEYIVRLSDYGLHRLMTPAGVAGQMLHLGAFGYRAPELAGIPNPTPSFKADVYAFGVILMELLTRRSPGDIISGQVGAVDLTDWVRLCDQEGRRMDCLDADIAGRDEPPKAMDDMLTISLRCILPVNERPNIRQILEDLSTVSV